MLHPLFLDSRSESEGSAATVTSGCAVLRGAAVYVPAAVCAGSLSPPRQTFRVLRSCSAGAWSCVTRSNATRCLLPALLALPPGGWATGASSSLSGCKPEHERPEALRRERVRTVCCRSSSGRSPGRQPKGALWRAQGSWARSRVGFQGRGRRASPLARFNPCSTGSFHVFPPSPGPASAAGNATGDPTGGVRGFLFLVSAPRGPLARSGALRGCLKASPRLCASPAPSPFVPHQKKTPGVGGSLVRFRLPLPLLGAAASWGVSPCSVNL